MGGRGGWGRDWNVYVLVGSDQDGQGQELNEYISGTVRVLCQGTGEPYQKMFFTKM